MFFPPEADPPTKLFLAEAENPLGDAIFHPHLLIEAVSSIKLLAPGWAFQTFRTMALAKWKNENHMRYACTIDAIMPPSK